MKHPYTHKSKCPPHCGGCSARPRGELRQMVTPRESPYLILSSEQIKKLYIKNQFKNEKIIVLRGVIKVKV